MQYDGSILWQISLGPDGENILYQSTFGMFDFDSDGNLYLQNSYEGNVDPFVQGQLNVYKLGADARSVVWAKRTDLAHTFYGGPAIVHQDFVFFGGRVQTAVDGNLVTLAKMRRSNGDLLFYKGYTWTGSTATSSALHGAYGIVDADGNVILMAAYPQS